MVLISCAQNKVVVLGGVEDYIRIPKGSKVCEVPLPTDENKKYCVVADSDSVLLSLKAWDRLEKSK